MPTPFAHVVVCGGGISGLLAAWRIATARPHATVTLYEAADYLGGKLHTRDFARGPVDVGAEAFVVRRPEALNLVEELGLSAWLRQPAGRKPALYSDGALRTLPTAQVFGIPADTAQLDELLPADVIKTIGSEPQRPFPWVPGQDAVVGQLVAQQLGREVVDRMVDPMLGGVYAASAYDLGLRAVAPNLAAQLDAQAAKSGQASLVEAVRAVRATAVSGQVFGTLEGGYRRLVDALAAAAQEAGVNVHLNTRVVSITPAEASPSGAPQAEVLVDAPSGDRLSVRVSALVVALPAPATAQLLRPLAPRTADAFAQVRCSSSAVVTLELEPGVEVPELSGVLVAADAGRKAKAITFSSRKWDHVDLSAEGKGHVLRVSFGRLDDESALELKDNELIALAQQELTAITGIPARVVDAHVQRWIDGLPVPGAGHGQWMAEAGSALAEVAVPTVVAGAAVNGVGVPVCIETAEAAAQQLVAQWQD